MSTVASRSTSNGSIPSETGAIAHHLLEAHDSRDPAHTIDVVFRAAEQATDRGGFDEAATLLARADAQLGDAISVDATLRRELRLRLGESEKNAGRSIYSEHLRAVAHAALETGDTPRLVRAVLARSRVQGTRFAPRMNRSRSTKRHWTRSVPRPPRTARTSLLSLPSNSVEKLVKALVVDS